MLFRSPIELRDAIVSALSAPPTGASSRVHAPAGKKVFQYLGNLNRPRQIAFTSGASRLVYDFRTRLARLDNGAWQRPGALSGDASRRFDELIHFWERMALARGKTRRATDD